MAKPDRTEKATPKRRAEARKKGQVARSQDVNAVVGLVAAITSLSMFGSSIAHRLEGTIVRALALARNPQALDGGALGSLAGWALSAFALAIAPVVLATAVGALVANLAQVRLKVTPTALQPSFSKLNPAAGIRRLLGPTGAVEAAKASAKLAVVAGIAVLSVEPRLAHLAHLTGATPSAVLASIGQESRGIALRVVPVLAILAAADYAWQRFRLERNLRMTKEEVKQEGRQTDVAPEVRRAIRRRQFQLARRRMLAAVPSADVVVVNPTHFAVALRYDGTHPAPEVVAKGADLVAAAIRAAAEEHGVPVVHDAPLARALHRDVELGAQIPEALFVAVAEVLAFVYRTAGRRPRIRRPAHRGRQALNPAPARSINPG